jgi:DNA-binding CsgD family transcriptional regulator
MHLVKEEATESSALERGRELFARNAWGEAYEQLSIADREAPLPPQDLERLAEAAHLIGKAADTADLLGRAHHEFLNRGDIEQAARCAFWLGFQLTMKGQTANGGGWLSRARRVLDEAQHDCAVRGYLLLPDAIRSAMGGDAAAGYAGFGQAVEIGDRFGDRNLVIFGRHGQGRALVRMGRVAEGLTLLDEVMVAVLANEMMPVAVGDVYCSVLEACHEIFDLRRAQEWTEAFTRWCTSQPELVPYRGHCLIRRAEIMQLHGAWSDAMDEALRAIDRLSDPPGQTAVGGALYQEADLHRLRGELGKAETTYFEAAAWERQPRPGIALLRLAQGQIDAAATAIRRVFEDAHGYPIRSRILAPYIEIMLAANDVSAARKAADELSKIAAEIGAPFLRALAAQWSGAVLVAEGQPSVALSSLRDAWAEWRELDAPYEAARTRVLIGLAHRALGDADTAKMELDAAGQVFRQLGALPDLRQVETLSKAAAPRRSLTLTSREEEVLLLIAGGKTNRVIAERLGISEKTVARHVSNIFTKLGLSNRAAATAYAYQHQLI